MGGNAMREFGAVRINKDEFDSVSSDILSRLSECGDDDSFRIIPSYHLKETFGDIDVLMDSGNSCLDCVIKSLEPSEVVRNGPCTSVLFRNRVQVDLISVDSMEFEFAYRYFSFNDLGNLIGRVYHRAGFKFGHDGMWYIMRDPENDSRVVKPILVTRDFDKALEFMGYSRYDPANFMTLEDVFEYALSSPHSSKDIFLLENRNHTSRVRDRKRLTYMNFLVYLSNDNRTKEYSRISKAHFLKTALEVFPDFKEEYENSLNKMEKDREFRSKFNGDIVMMLTGLSGRDLGKFIQEFLSRHRQQIEEMESSDVRNLIIKEFQEYTK